MPIPQLNKKRSTTQRSARDASAIRKQRARERVADSVGEKKTAKGKKLPTSQAHQRKKRSVRRSQKKPKKGGPRGGPKPWWKHLLKWGFILAGVGLVTGIIALAAAYAWVSKDLADITDLENRTIDQSTRIYARDGETLLYELGDNKREDVPLNKIDDKIKWATIALEDKEFYNHNGFRWQSFARAAFKGALGSGGARGTSTLTQQFVKNAILTPERTYTRKVKEVILSVRLERKYSKEEILNLYLNEVYYGSVLQGVEVAAREYFGKTASDVTLAEAATLAALPQSPVSLPNNPDRLKARRDHALNQMAEQGFVTEEEAEAAKQEPVSIQENITEISAPHFVFYVREQLEKDFGTATIRKGGLKVITTLDWDKQQKAEQAINDGIGKIESFGGSNAALVSLDSHTGQVLAMVGSRDYFDETYDGNVNVAVSLRQPGSSFKPIVYLAAFAKGFTPDTKLFDVETDFPTETGNYRPRNYDLGQRGPVSLRSALGQSLNIPAVKLLYLVGVDTTLDLAEALGYTSFGDRSRFGLALVLGGGEVTLLEHTTTFSAFAREGEYRRPSSILKVEDQSGNTLYEWENSSIQAVDQNAVRTLNSVLSDPGARGGFTALNLNGRQSAAKTGTTNDYRDAWTIGYTPSFATGVWVGNNDNSEMARGAAGLVVAAPIWNQYMNSILEGLPAETFNAPSYSSANEALGGSLETTEELPVDSVTGELIPEECRDSYPEEFTSKREFKTAHNILHYITKDEPTGGAPEDPRTEAMYEPWETAVVNWSKEEERRNEYLSDETPRVDCGLRDKSKQPKVSITTLKDGKEYSKKEFSIHAVVTPGDGRSVVSIEYKIDNTTVETQAVGIDSKTSAVSTYSPKSLTGGRHSVTVTVTDDKGNTATDTVSITYTGKK